MCLYLGRSILVIGKVSMDKTPENNIGKSPVAWGEGRIAFLAHKADIQEKINLGWPLAKIYRDFQDRLIGLSYPGFSRAVREYLGVSKPRNTKATIPAMATLEKKEISQKTAPPMSFFQKGDREPNPDNLI